MHNFISFSPPVAHLLPIPPSTILLVANMSSRVGLRFSQSFRQTLSRTRQTVFRRHQGTTANPAVEGAPAQPQSIFKRLWTSEVGVKTVHFWYVNPCYERRLRRGVWSKSVDCNCLAVANTAFPICRAPVMKWGVVLAGASDFVRPADKLSLTQNLALMATGSIWSRWCFVIRPKNML